MLVPLTFLTIIGMKSIWQLAMTFAAPEPVTGLLIGEEYPLQNVIDMEFDEKDFNADMDIEMQATLINFNEAAAMDVEFGCEEVAMLEGVFGEGCMELEDDTSSRKFGAASPSLSAPFESVFGGFAAKMASATAAEVPANAVASFPVTAACDNTASATSIDLVGQSTSDVPPPLHHHQPHQQRFQDYVLHPK